MASASPHSRSYHAQRLWSHVARRPEVNHRAARRGCSVYWVISKQEWFALRWCHITLYDTGVVRFTSRVEPQTPKSLWPWSPSRLSDERLEITLAADEPTERDYARLADIFTHPEKALDWELLQQTTSDTNLWSDRAVLAEKRARDSHASKR